MPDLGSKAADRIQKKLRKLIKEQRVEYLIHEARAPHVVRDFNTLPDLINHAARDLGATHTSGSDAHTKIYFPRGGQHPYEEATVWRKSGYWHAQGPGARTGVARLPAGAKPIAGHAGRRAAEHVSEYVDPALIEAFAADVDALREAKGISYDQAFDQMNKPAWFRSYIGQRPEDKIDLENRIINKAKSIGRARSRISREPQFKLGAPRPGTSVRDYKAAGEARRGKGFTPTERAQAAGEKYAVVQIQTEHFDNWVRDQLIEASKMPEDQVLPLETPDDARKIARNMLQQLEWDIKRDADVATELESYGVEVTRETEQAFFKGVHKALQDSGAVAR